MFSNLNFSFIPGFSRLFLDFISGSAFFDSRFPFNESLFNNKPEILKRNSSIKQRTDTKKLLISSMNSIELTHKQKNNLELFTGQNTFTVMTGQQVGFLGGPLYTFYKTATVIALAEKLKSIYPDLNFIPVFWVEDNDHDNFEASQNRLFDKSYGIKGFSCESGLIKDDRTPVSELIFSESIHNIIANIETELPETEFKHGLTEFLKSIYRTGESWCDAFISF
ncbi:MAG: bacillithiol biosynthesis BshC, partial [Ignavibacteria bacterium]|nr:bacillithiol biosynthesis BshC [Ignavibacteria bacterium]